MGTLTESARVYNIVTAKLQHATHALTLNEVLECPDLKGVDMWRIRDCVRSLHKSGKVRKLTVSTPNPRERVGYEWRKPGDTVKEEIEGRSAKREVTQEDLRIRVNQDRSVTIITSKIKITIEVPV